MIKAVLFDLDGTLIDSSEGITKSAQFALEHYGINEPDLGKLSKFIGPPLHLSFAKYYGFDADKAMEAVSVFRSRYNVTGVYESTPYPGVKECLLELREKGYLVAVASSKPEKTCNVILEYHGLLDLFDNISGASMDGKIGTKEQVLDQLFARWPDVDRDSMVLVGDTIFDIKGANNAGLKSIAVSFGFGDVDEMMNEGASALCDDMRTLPGIIENL